MNTVPSLKRFLAAGLTGAIFLGVIVAYAMYRFGDGRLVSAEQPNAAEQGRGAKQPKGADLPSWPMFGGTLARNMVSLTSKGLPAQWTDNDGELIKNKVLWVADLGSRAYGGPMVAGGKVFVGTNNQAPRDPKYKSFKTAQPSDKITEVDGKAVKDPAALQEIIDKLPLGKVVPCTILREGKAVKENCPIVTADLGVLMAFDQVKGTFDYQTAFRKLPNGQVCDWPLEGLCSTPAAEGDRMWYTSNRCEVVCAEIKTGKPIWTYDMIKELGVFPHNLTVGCPLIVGDDLYVVTANGVDEGHINVPAPTAPSFLKMNKNNGNVLWSDNTPTIKLAQANKGGKPEADFFKNLINRGELIQHGQWSNPAYGVVGGQAQVVWPGGDGWIYSYDPAGKLLWKFDCNPKDSRYELGGKGTRSDFIATPVIYKDRVYIGVGQDPEHNPGVGHFWCIDMTKRGDVSPELVTDGSVFPPKTKENPNSAKVWHYGGFVKEARGKRNYYFGRTMSTCAIHDDLVYIADLGGVLTCLDAKTGTVYWDHDTRSYTWSSPYWADGKVYLGTDGGDVWVFAHGKQKKLIAKNEMNLPVRATPVAAGNVLYVISGNKLYALKD